MTASVSGSRATLGWRAPTSGSSPSSYLIDVGTASGTSNVAASYNVGNTLGVYGDLPRGTYYARVRAANGTGVSLFSNEVRFSIGKKLRTPTGFRVSWTGTTATLSWTSSAADGVDEEPTNYVLEAGTAPGASNVATVNVGNTTTFRTEVSSGNYFVRVKAQNSLGESIRPRSRDSRPRHATGTDCADLGRVGRARRICDGPRPRVATRRPGLSKQEALRAAPTWRACGLAT